MNLSLCGTTKACMCASSRIPLNKLLWAPILLLQILSFTCSLLSLKKRIRVVLGYYQDSDSLNTRERERESVCLLYTCTQRSVTELKMFTYSIPRTSGVNTASDADDATKRTLEVKKKERDERETGLSVCRMGA